MKPNTSILFTGGIGDVIALASYMPLEYRQSIKSVYWAAFRGSTLRPLFSGLPDFQKARHVVLKHDWSDGPLYNLSQVETATGKSLVNVEDWSIEAKFPEIAKGLWSYQGCPFLAAPLADPVPELPDRYIVIQGATSQNAEDFQTLRNLAPFEWRAIDRDLERQGLVGVVLDVAGPPLPLRSPRLLDMRGLTLASSIDVLKDERCCGYWGIDSFLAILATRRFPDRPEALRIRAKNRHYHMWKWIYAAPYTYFPFLSEEIR